MITRRDFLKGFIASIISLYFYDYVKGKSSEEIFPQGIASGDPTSRGILLWTRIAPEIHKKYNADLVLEISEHPEFKKAKSTFKIKAEKINQMNDYTIKLDINKKLSPDKRYFYRFIYMGIPSMIGSFRIISTSTSELSLAFVVCQNYSDGYFIAYRAIAGEDINFVIHLGDFIYEKIYGQPRVKDREISLPSGSNICMNLEDYRHLYRTYLSDPDLKLARAMHPFINTWDDHEFLNDYYYDYDKETWGYHVGHPYENQKEKILELRQASIKAWSEYIPARVKIDLTNKNPLKWITLYRSIDLGDLGILIITDLRSYREKQPCNQRFGAVGCEEQYKTSMLGQEQREWFLSKIQSNHKGWILWASSVQFISSSIDGKYGSLDAWDGYAMERKEILNTLAKKQSHNLIVLSGDRHASMVSEIPDDFHNPKGVVGAEFMAPALTSINAMEGGWWKRNWPNYKSLEDLEKAELDQNPWIQYLNSRNCWGYGKLRVKKDQVECIVYSVNKYKKCIEKSKDAQFIYQKGKLFKIEHLS